MTRVAVIACDHGLGHVRRCLGIARALVARGADVDLLAPSEAVARVTATLGAAAAEPTLVHFATATTPEALVSGDPRSTRWYERLPDLEAYDAVVSDTLPEVLLRRPDAVLVAQFLWHDVLADADPAYRAAAAALLADHAGTVLGSGLFAMPAVTRLPGFVPIGLVAAARAPGDADDPGAPSGVPRDTLLVSGGTTDALARPLAALVGELAGAGPPEGLAEVAVDPALLRVDAPTWLRRFRFDAADHARVAVALVRPGLGTVTDLLRHGSAIAGVHETGAAELAHNARVIASHGYGIDVGAVPSDAASVGSVVEAARRANVSAERPSFSGADDAAGAVLARLAD